MQKTHLLFLGFLFSFTALLAQKPLAFQPAFRANQGQWSPEIKYRCDFAPGAISFLDNGFSVGNYLTDEKQKNLVEAPDRISQGKTIVWNLVFKNANAQPQILASGKKESYSNYFIGNDPSHWASFVPEYEEIVYKNVWNGIDVKFLLHEGRFEYDFILHPGADRSDIRLSFEGVDSLSANGKNLLVYTPAGIWEEEIPLCYFETDGIKKITAAEYFSSGENEISFKLAEETPPGALLVIDPVAHSYGTFVTGASTQPWGWIGDIVTDSLGFVYGCGHYPDFTFPTTAGSYSPGYNGGSTDAFVFKLNQTGTALVYSTFFGGSDDDRGAGLRISAGGDVYFTGLTLSTNLPTNNGVLLPAKPVNSANYYYDCYVAHLGAGGASLIWCTYLGGSEDDYVMNLRLDNAGNSYVVGHTTSPDFPVTVGSFNNTHNGPPQSSDIFVCKLNPAATALVYGTFVGGAGGDAGMAIDINAAGEAFVTGYTTSSDFPVTPGVLRQNLSVGSWDAYAFCLNAQGSALVYSTFIGSGFTGNDIGWGIAVNAANEAFITGNTLSTGFPVTPGAYDQVYNGGQNNHGDAFVLRLNAQATALIYSTFLGGAYEDLGSDLVLTANNEVWVTGFTGQGMTSGNHFPITDCTFDDWPNVTGSSQGDFEDIFLAKFSADGSTLLWSTYYGGTGRDDARGIALCEKACTEEVFVAALIEANYTNLVSFPTTPGAFQVNPMNNLGSSPAVFKFTFRPDFTFTAAVDTGCSGRVFFSVPADTSTCPVLQDLASGVSNWQWDFGDGNTASSNTAEHTYTSPGTFTVMAMSPCDTIIQTVSVNPCPEAPCTNFIPNAFSPNDDGENDLLFVRGNCISAMQLDIYNRWGEKVFTSNDLSNGWDGTFRGKKCEPAVFVYMLKLTLYDGTTKTQSGNISLVR